MKQKLWSLLLAAALVLACAGCGAADLGVIGGPDGPTEIITGGTGQNDATLDPDSGGEEPEGDSVGYEEPEQELPAIDEDGTYNSAEDVALYLHTYGELPDNFITKNEAQGLGWTGGSVERYAPGMCIGGDTFGNREGLLPQGNYHECDINTLGAESRGAERIVWDTEGNIYYTDDHYESFELVYRGDGE